MNEQAIKDLMKLKLQDRTIEDLKEIATELFDDDSDGAMISSEVVLDVLEERMNEQDFVEFCDSF